jgi:hypothetical protein
VQHPVPLTPNETLLYAANELSNTVVGFRPAVTAPSDAHSASWPMPGRPSASSISNLTEAIPVDRDLGRFDMLWVPSTVDATYPLGYLILRSSILSDVTLEGFAAARATGAQPDLDQVGHRRALERLGSTT